MQSAAGAVNASEPKEVNKYIFDAVFYDSQSSIPYSFQRDATRSRCSLGGKEIAGYSCFLVASIAKREPTRRTGSCCGTEYGAWEGSNPTAWTSLSMVTSLSGLTLQLSAQSTAKSSQISISSSTTTVILPNPVLKDQIPEVTCLT